MSPQQVRLSKYLSYILRHDPESIGLELDREGWIGVEALIQRSAENGYHFTREDIELVVAQNDKQRFKLSADGRFIRANQGHSIPVDLGLVPTTPPAILYHGTATRFLPSIQEKGLQPGSRQHVHLSIDVETALKVGSRHGRPVVLCIDAGRLHAEGHAFYCAENGVWLTDSLPVGYFTVLADSDNAETSKFAGNQT